MKKYTEEQIHNIVNNTNIFTRFNYYIMYYIQLLGILIKMNTYGVLYRIQIAIGILFFFDLETIINYYNEFDLL